MLYMQLLLILDRRFDMNLLVVCLYS